MDKFKMELVWHNCVTCPPKEDYNGWLIITDGEHASEAVWYNNGWYRHGCLIEDTENCWWADIIQTVRNSKEFDYEAEWKYWCGWIGNHDQRIDDATCSKCGYKHPNVRREKGENYDSTPNKLSDYCANCGSKMKKQ